MYVLLIDIKLFSLINLLYGWGQFLMTGWAILLTAGAIAPTVNMLK